MSGDDVIAVIGTDDYWWRQRCADAAWATTNICSPAQRHAVALTRILSTHHATCGPCQRGGRVVAGRAGVRRERCEVERRLLAELGAAQAEGWPV